MQQPNQQTSFPEIVHPQSAKLEEVLQARSLEISAGEHNMSAAMSVQFQKAKEKVEQNLFGSPFESKITIPIDAVADHQAYVNQNYDNYYEDLASAPQPATSNETFSNVISSTPQTDAHSNPYSVADQRDNIIPFRQAVQNIAPDSPPPLQMNYEAPSVSAPSAPEVPQALFASRLQPSADQIRTGIDQIFAERMTEEVRRAA